MLLNNQQITEKIKKEIKICIETNESENTNKPKPMGLSKSRTRREIHSNKSLPQETIETSNKHPSFTPKATRKRKEESQN